MMQRSIKKMLRVPYSELYVNNKKLKKVEIKRLLETDFIYKVKTVICLHVDKCCYIYTSRELADRHDIIDFSNPRG